MLNVRDGAEEHLCTHRHPSYSGALAIAAGLFIWQSSPGSWIRESGLLMSWEGRFFVGICAIWIISMSEFWFSVGDFNHGPWTLETGLGVFLRMRTEDEILREEFGDQWRSWAEKVPYVLVPFVY